MKKIIATLVLMLGMLMLSPVPVASAGSCTGPICGTVNHTSPDDGYDAAFRIACGWSGGPTNLALVGEGGTSKQHCADMDGIYVRDGEELHCLQPQWWGGYAYSLMFDATGWYKVTDAWNYSCVNQLD